MADIDWPSTLVPLVGSIREAYVPAYVDDSSEIGTARRRKNQTRTLKKIGWDLRMTNAQAAALRTFIETTTDGGTKGFNWTHPVTSDTYELRFADLPGIDDVTKGVWSAQILTEQY